MNAFERKIALRVVGVHAGIILVLLISSALRGCFKPKPKDLVTFIEFGGPAASVDLQQVARMEEPTPQQPSAPDPEPAPIPEPVKQEMPKPVPKQPALKPEPVKPKPKPKPVKPKERLVKASEIDTSKAKRINETPSKPLLSASDISKAFSDLGSSGASANPSQFNNYLGSVMQYFYKRWKPPATASSATGSAVVRISMRKNGQITKRSKIKSSGDALYDKTVMDAVNAAGTLPRPPSDYPYDYVEIEFTLDH